MAEGREPRLCLRLLCFHAVREHFCALGAHAAAVLPCNLLEELQFHLTVCQLDSLQPALNRRGVSTLSGWKEILRNMRGPFCVLDVSSEGEAKHLVMKGLFSSVLYDFKSDFISKNLSNLNTSWFLGAAARCLRHFVLLNLVEPLRRLIGEQRTVLDLLERSITSVGVSHSLDPAKAENQLALLVLHRLLDHGQCRRVVLQARCPLTLAWILHGRSSQVQHMPEGKTQVSALCSGPWSCSNKDHGPARKRPKLDHREEERGGVLERKEDQGGGLNCGEDQRAGLDRREGGGQLCHKKHQLTHRKGWEVSEGVSARAGEDGGESISDRLGDCVGGCVGDRDSGAGGGKESWREGVGDKLGGSVSPEACPHGHIESLELRQCQVDCLGVLLRALPFWSCLKSLTLHSYASFTKSSVVELSRALQEQSKATEGGVTQLSISTLPCTSLLERLLEACPQLLSFSAEVHSIAGPSRVWSLPLSPNHRQFSLQKLSVNLNQQPSAWLLLPSLLQRCPRLCSLHLCGLRLQTGASYGQLLTTLAECCRCLRSLSLEDVNLSDCLEHVLLLLRCCQLHELCLKDCRLLEKWNDKEDSLQQLTSTLAAHKTLQSLSLAHNRIARHVPVLAQLFSAPDSALQRLDLSSNFIQPEELLEFSKRLRALRPGRRITLDLRRNPGDRDPHTWSVAVSSLALCCHLLLEGWKSTDSMVDHISNM
ncbi:uncharacterized protein lrrc41 [Periophthalmus magnuspinnatus]|uniref:uncharacterized protein lrrc41 n=1 Tax=Periophthalmus magnuspinnatus TaxID=409849 RepID=UPI0024367E97|nr:uncharacterized protein lrrc41 [Periophthalmus magnuspinnatus]